MELFNPGNTRHAIIHDYARWCAFSATRSGCPLKARKDVYPLIDIPNYPEVLSSDSSWTTDRFFNWHEKYTLQINEATGQLLGIGWATKLINVYLKTMVYVGGIGPASLIDCIHPPIDGGFWQGIKQAYETEKDILAKTHTVSKIKDITSYQIYQSILAGCKLITQRKGWKLIEIEKLWTGTSYKS